MRQITIEILVFSAALGLTFACSSRPSEESDVIKEKKETDLDEERTTEPSDAPEAVFEGPGEMVPKTVDGFEISSNPRYFGPGNLYDLINGGAEIYAEFVKGKPLRRMGIRDTFTESDNYDVLRNHYGLSDADVLAAVQGLLDT